MVEVLDALDDVEPMADAHAAGTHCLLDVVVGVVLGLASVVHLLQVQVRPLFQDPVAHADVRLHRPIGVFLLHEVDPDHARPLVGAGLVQPAEVAFLSIEFESKEDETCREGGVLLPYLVIDLVEGSHELALVVLLDEGSVGVVLLELDQESPELHSLVAVLEVLEQDVPHVFLEDVQGEEQDEEAADFLLEEHPEVMLHSRNHF